MEKQNETVEAEIIDENTISRKEKLAALAIKSKKYAKYALIGAGSGLLVIVVAGLLGGSSEERTEEEAEVVEIPVANIEVNETDDDTEASEE